jgi:hypothetical protein
LPTVCQPLAQYDPNVKLTVTSASTTALEARVEGMISLELPADCCQNDNCDSATPPASFTPGGPFALDGRLSAAF